MWHGNLVFCGVPAFIGNIMSESVACLTRFVAKKVFFGGDINHMARLQSEDPRDQTWTHVLRIARLGRGCMPRELSKTSGALLPQSETFCLSRLAADGVRWREVVFGGKFY